MQVDFELATGMSFISRVGLESGVTVQPKNVMTL